MASEKKKAEADADGPNRARAVYPDPGNSNLSPYPTLSQYGTYGPFPGSTAARHMVTTDPSSSNPPLAPLPTLAPLLPATSRQISPLDAFRTGSLADGVLPVRNVLPASGPGTIPSWPGVVSNEEIRDDQDDRDPLLNSNDADNIDQLMGYAVRGPKRGRPRGSGRAGRGQSRGRGGWRQLLKGTDWEDVGRGPGRPRSDDRGTGRRGRKKKHVDPGRTFKTYLAQANQAFVDGDLEAAADHARQAVLENPEIFQAHSLLAEILKAQGQGEDAAEALRIGAITLRLPHVWVKAAEEMLALGGEDPSPDLIKKAISCYGDALKLRLDDQPELHYEIRFSKFQLYKQLGDFNHARQDCKNILRIWPDKIALLREFAELSAAWNDRFELTKAKDLYEKGFELRADKPTFGTGGEDSWSHLNIYLELCDLVNLPEDGLMHGKRLARWFLGRQDEAFWDRFKDDDREFDMDTERRALVAEFQQGKASMDRSQYGEGLPIEIRIKFGLFRTRMGYRFREEALRHYTPLHDYVEHIEEYYDMFLQVANSLKGAGYFKEALDFYEPLRRIPEELDENAWMSIASSYHANRRFQDAIECYEEVVGFKGNCYARASASLAQFYESSGDLIKAKFLCNELIKLGRRDLLSDEQVRMITPDVPTHPLERTSPAKLLPLPPPEVVSRLSAPSPPILPTADFLRPDIPTRTLRPLLPDDGSLRTPISGSGQVTNDEIQYEDDDTATQSQFRRRKRLSDQAGNIMSATRGSLDDVSEDEASPLKRPRFRRPYMSRKKRAALEERKQQIQDAEARVRVDYAILIKYWTAMLKGDDQDAVERWLDAATNLMEEFLAVKVFFPERDKNVKVTARSDTIVKSYKTTSLTDNTTAMADECHNIPLSEWHRIFSDIALLYVRTGEQDKCQKILQDILFGSIAFCHNPRLDRASYGVAIHCALAFNDSQYLCDLARKIITNGDYRAGMAFQLFAALNRLTFASNWFNAGPSQKFMLRMVKQADYMIMPEDVREQIEWSISRPALETRIKKLNDGKNELDAGVLMMYGHMVAVANHSHSAVVYYYRALALQPENICVNLSIATMWVQLSMKRQTENRHAGISQGLAFLCRYYDLRTRGGRACEVQEAEYNVARMWHYLGLTHLAIPGYEKVLNMSSSVQEEALKNGQGLLEDGTVVEDFSREAAFALQGIYALVGHADAARKITEEWLVI